MGLIIDATETQGYQMKEGDGPAACISKDGNYQLLLKSAKLNDKAADSGNRTVSLTEIVQDSDPADAKGAVVYHSFPVTGKVEKGANAGRLNVGTLIDLCISAGRQDLADTIIGKKFDVEQLLTALVGSGKTMVFARLTQQEDNRNGTMKSQPSFYIRPEKYAESKASGANFRTNPNSRKRATPGAPASAGNGALPTATDAMSSDV